MTTSATQVRVLVMLDELPAAVSSLPGVRIDVNDQDPAAGFYSSVPGSAVCVISDPDRPEAIDALERIQQTHLAFITRAALSGLNGMTRRGHSPDAIDQLSAITGRGLPQPSYVTPTTP